MKQSFQDGCKKIVDKLTALGYTPASPQGPNEINTQIASIYNTRYTNGYNAGKVAGTNIPGMALNLSVGEAGYGDQTYASIPINNLNSIAFTVNKGYYGIFIIYLNGVEYYRAPMQTVLTNQRFTITLNKAYSSIMFVGHPHGGSGSAITVTDFATT